jgi:hypothetical protein
MTTNLNRTQLARLSDISYQKFNTTKRKWARDIDSNLDFNNQLSNKYASVITDNRNNNVYLNFRGTKLDDLSDLSADLSILTGTEDLHKRFKEANDHFSEVKKKLGDKKNYIITGHSLGGALGASVAKKNDLEAHLFNIGSSVLNVRSNSAKPPEPVKERENTITHYHTTDIISAGAALDPHSADKTIKVKCKNSVAINCHSLSNFL